MAKYLTIVDDADRIEVESEFRRRIRKVGRSMYAADLLSRAKAICQYALIKIESL